MKFILDYGAVQQNWGRNSGLTKTSNGLTDKGFKPNFNYTPLEISYKISKYILYSFPFIYF